jgi:trans-aconitate 2-methyltransferase
MKRSGDVEGSPDSTYDFNGEMYRDASRHQKEWGSRIISELGLRGGERIIDLGCGDGVLTKRLADLAPRGSVLGIDSSPSMIATAKRLKGENLRFLQLDIDDLSFEGEFDVAFSNATLHWVKDHRRLLANVKRALRDGGTARFNFGGDGNCANFIAVVREVMALSAFQSHFEGKQWPWFMPSLHEYEAIVSSAGFSQHRVWMENADRTFTEKELIDWIDQPSIVPLLAMVGEEDKKAFRDGVVGRMLETTRTPEGSYFETFRRMNLLAVK